MGNIITDIIITYRDPVFLVNAAFLLDVIIGDPAFFPHPVRLMGGLISGSEHLLYIDSDPKGHMRRGALLFLINIMVPVSVVCLLLFLFGHWGSLPAAVFSIIICTYCIAAGDLRKAALRVMAPCMRGDMEEARKALSMIVGRDTERLEMPGIIRGAVESVAESTCDGVIAPLFYMFLLGPVGGILYKAVNTMDSMIGYHNERYEYFGRVAAIADDIFNFIPSRISALCVIFAGCILHLDHNRGYAVWRRDRHGHASPNSAQTESAMAGLLGLRLGGDAYYGGILLDKPFIGDGVREPRPEDIRIAVRVMYTASVIFLVIATLLRLGCIILLRAVFA